MTHEQILAKIKRGDFILASKMTQMSSVNAQLTFSRTGSKKYNKVKQALIKIIENREALIIESTKEA